MLAYVYNIESILITFIYLSNYAFDVEYCGLSHCCVFNSLLSLALVVCY